MPYWPVELLLRWSLRSGPLLRGRLGRDRYVYLLSPEANRLVFAHDEWFSVHDAMKGLIPVDGETSVVVSDGADHDRRRRLLRPALAPRSIEGYLDAMTRSAAEAMTELPAGDPVDAYPVFRRAIRRATLRSLFGREMAEDADRLGELLQPLLDLVDRLPQGIEVHRRLRTPTWRRAMAARAALDGYVDRRIDEARRGEPGSASLGLLDQLVHGRDDEGTALSRQEIRDQTVTLIAAGYETTSGAMGWAVHSLARHPEWQERARDEAVAVRDDPALAARPGGLRVLPAVVTETLRLYPPATITARRVEQDFTAYGQRVRAGDMVILSPYATQRSPRVFADPTRFDPARWIDLPPPEAGTVIPFGGGAHRCIGHHMATTELTVMLAHLIAAGPFGPDGPTPGARSFTAMRPSHARILRHAG